jgi:hypothetical protein
MNPWLIQLFGTSHKLIDENKIDRLYGYQSFHFLLFLKNINVVRLKSGSTHLTRVCSQSSIIQLHVQLRTYSDFFRVRLCYIILNMYCTCILFWWRHLWSIKIPWHPHVITNVSMASLIESYEQQYSSLTADIVSKTGRIPNLAGSMCLSKSWPQICFNNIAGSTINYNLVTSL